MLAVILTLVVVGVLLYLLQEYVPMDATIKRIIHIVVIVLVVLWLLQITGLLPLADIPVPKLR